MFSGCRTESFLPIKDSMEEFERFLLNLLMQVFPHVAIFVASFKTFL